VVAKIRNPRHETVLAQVLAEPAIVAFVQGDTVIPNSPCGNSLPVQTPVPVGVIELEFERLT
jgi:hypothetical protein